MPFAEHNGVKLFYTDDGDGEVVLLLHGWCCDGQDWSWQAPALVEAGYRTIILDHRGHGRSSVPDQDYRPQTLAHDAAALLDGLGISTAIVMGHSMGTVVASVLAVQRPDLVSALVLVDPVYHVSSEMAEAQTKNLAAPDPQGQTAKFWTGRFYKPHSPAWLRQLHARRLSGIPAHVVRGCWEGLYGTDESIGRAAVAQNYMPQRKAPRFVGCAATATADFERTFPMGEHDEVHVFTGGHFFHQHERESEEFNQAALKWLSQFRK
jgi:pimeloyl-ACP methyl ester carboxylesterase